jgi:hypothetical protein
VTDLQSACQCNTALNITLQPSHTLSCLSMTLQVDLTARGSASLIRLVPQAVLDMYDGHSLQDITLNLKDTQSNSVELLGCYTLVKDAAAMAADHCDGKSATTRMVIQVTYCNSTSSVHCVYDVMDTYLYCMSAKV